MRFAAPAFCFVIPLAVAPQLMLYYDITPKVVLIFLSAAAGLAFVCVRLDCLRALVATPLGKAYAAATGASAAIAVAAASLSANPALAWNGSNWRRYGAFTECAALAAAAAICTWASGEPSRMRTLLRAVCAAGLLAALYGISQYFGGDPLLPRTRYTAGEGPFTIVRPPSTLGHADYFAALLLWPVFAGIGLAREETGRFWKALPISSVAAGVAAIVLSGSRGAAAALATGLFSAYLLFRPHPRALTWTLAAAFAILAAFYMSPAGARLRARVHWIGEDPAGGARLPLWRDSLRMAAARPLRGFGPDNFVAEFPKFQSVELARAYPDFSHESPHNIFLDAAASEGLAGFLALAAFTAIGIVAGVKASCSPGALGRAGGVSALRPVGSGMVAQRAFAANRGAGFSLQRRLQPPSGPGLKPRLQAKARSTRAGHAAPPENRRGALGRALLAGLIASLVAHQFVAFTAPTAFYFYLGIGMVVAGGVRQGAARAGRLSPSRWLGLAGSAFFVLLAWRLLSADVMLAETVRRLDAGDTTGAAQAYRKALKHSGAGVTADLYLAGRWAAIASNAKDTASRWYYSQVALGAASLAARSPEDRQNARYTLALLAAARGDPAAVETALHSAVDAGPNWYKPHWALARLLLEAGRLEQARAEASLAFTLNRKDPEVASTLTALFAPRATPPVPYAAHAESH